MSDPIEVAGGIELGGQFELLEAGYHLQGGLALGALTSPPRQVYGGIALGGPVTIRGVPAISGGLHVGGQIVLLEVGYDIDGGLAVGAPPLALRSVTVEILGGIALGGNVNVVEGTTYRAITDSAGITDTLSAEVIAGLIEGLISDTVGATDSSSVSRMIARTISETVAPVDEVIARLFAPGETGSNQSKRAAQGARRLWASRYGRR